MKIVPGKEIEDRFTYLAQSIFGLSLNTYKLNNNNRNILGYAIDKESQSFSPLFGNPPSQLTDAINEEFNDSIAGYCVAAQAFFPISGLNADVLLLSTELGSSTDSDFDTILLHELCHLIIDSKSRSHCTLASDSGARFAGERLYKRTDKENVKRTKHTLEFCILLASAAKNYADSSTVLNSRKKVIDSAMRYDVAGGWRT